MDQNSGSGSKFNVFGSTTPVLKFKDQFVLLFVFVALLMLLLFAGQGGEGRVRSDHCGRGREDQLLSQQQQAQPDPAEVQDCHQGQERQPTLLPATGLLYNNPELGARSWIRVLAFLAF